MNRQFFTGFVAVAFVVVAILVVRASYGVELRTAEVVLATCVALAVFALVLRANRKSEDR